MKTKTFYTELAYVFGTLGLALGAASMEKAGFGLSMVIAPAYLIYLKLSQVWSFVTFGMAEYTLQACLIVAVAVILRKFRISYLFSFCTAVLYGLSLDACMALIAPIDSTILAWRIVLYIGGMFLCAVGVSMFFHTYITPGAYELFVKRISEKMNIDINRFKIAYDSVSCAVGILLSFLFFGLFHFEGISWGTVICALTNGRLIGLISKWMDKRYTFTDKFAIRQYFE